ncbi:MAG: pentapeptide repeat-containing protein, partial [Cyanobacteria bacterium P01_D01_bin.73]
MAKWTLKAIALGGIALSLSAVSHFTSSKAAVAIALNTDNPNVFLRRGARGCQGCDLNGVDLSNQKRSGAKLRQAQLEDADLSNSDFSVAYFTCANLSGADLRNSKFEYANFVDANLRGADLRGANLRRVDFSGAIIDDTTKFDGADLDGAKLWDAATLYDNSVDLDNVERT